MRSHLRSCWWAPIQRGGCLALAIVQYVQVNTNRHEFIAFQLFKICKTCGTFLPNLRKIVQMISYP